MDRTPRDRGWRNSAAVLIAMVVGSVAFGLSAQSSGTIGPVSVTVELEPSLDGQTTLEFPPFGRVIADTHRGPLNATATLNEIDIEQVRDLATGGELRRAEIEAWAEELKRTVARAATLGLLAALLAGCVVAWTLTRSWRSAAVTAMLVIVLPGGAVALSTVTFEENAFREPTYEGALTYAPAAFGLVQQKVTDIRSLQEQASGLAAALSAYYGVSQSIAPGGTLPNTYRVLHVSDQHLDPVGLQLGMDLAEAYDVEFVIDTGDISYFGSQEEGAFASARIGTRPYIFVPGNHDSSFVLDNLAALGNVTILDGETTTTPTGLTVLGVGDPDGTGLAYEPDREAAEEKGLKAAEASRETTPNIVAVHNPASGRAFGGMVDLVLSGHTHTPKLQVTESTVFLGAGTTGGVDFTDLTSDPNIPHSAAVLYFSMDEPGRLVAIDQIEVYGKTRQSSIRRTIIDEGFVGGE